MARVLSRWRCCVVECLRSSTRTQRAADYQPAAQAREPSTQKSMHKTLVLLEEQRSCVTLASTREMGWLRQACVFCFAGLYAVRSELKRIIMYCTNKYTRLIDSFCHSCTNFCCRTGRAVDFCFCSKTNEKKNYFLLGTDVAAAAEVDDDDGDDLICL
jgi:hypothetical protein